MPSNINTSTTANKATLTRHPSLIALQDAALAKMRADEFAAAEKANEEEQFDGCCDSYCVDLDATFGVCKCGFSKKVHNTRDLVLQTVTKKAASQIAEKLAAEEQIAAEKLAAEKAKEAEENKVIATVAATNARIAAFEAAAFVMQLSEEAKTAAIEAAKKVASEIETAAWSPKTPAPRPKLIVPVDSKRTGSAASGAISIAMFASAAAMEAAENASAAATSFATPPTTRTSAIASTLEINPSSPNSFTAALRKVVATATCRCTYLGMRNEMKLHMGRELNTAEKKHVTKLLVATEKALQTQQRC